MQANKQQLPQDNKHFFSKKVHVATIKLKISHGNRQCAEFRDNEAEMLYSLISEDRRAFASKQMHFALHIVM